MALLDSTRADVAALAQSHGDAVAFERGLLDLLARAIGFDVAFVESKSGARPPTLRGLDAARFASSLPQRAAYDRELAPVKRAAMAARGVAVDTAVLGAATVRESAYFRDLAAPVGGKHSLLAYAHVRGREVGGVMLGRTGGAFRAREIAFLEALLPTMALALASFERAAPVVNAPLTPRERDVLGYLCLGYTNAEIAHACGSSPNTVRNQLVKVFAKLGATTRAEAVGITLRGEAT